VPQERTLVLNDFLMTLVGFVLRVALFALGLLMFAVLATLALLLGLLWGARALWARLTGKPVAPWVWRVNPRQGFSAYRSTTTRWAARSNEKTLRSATLPGARDVSDADVIDVQPRKPGGAA
jgi:hypothetical protein